MNVDNSNQPFFMERASCPLCNSKEYVLYIAFSDIPVFRCKECSFIYSSHIMSYEAMIHYYKHTFSGDRHLQGQRVNATVNLAALERLIDLESIQSFLDIGTGYGFLLKALETNYDIQVKGIEPSSEEANYAFNTLKIDVRPVLLAESKIPKSSFDVVSCFEVIEHIAEPVEFISEMAEYAKVDGFMIIMTDNFTSTIATKLGAEFPKWIPHSHISHFHPETLIRCIETVPGLKVEKQLSYTPWELIVRNITKMCCAPKPPQQAYSLESSLKSEMRETYKLFYLRLALNSIWAKLTFQPDLSGALMFTLVRKT